MGGPERRRVYRLIAEEIYSRGVGSKFTARDIRMALELKGYHVDPHAISSFLRQKERFFKKERRDTHSGHTYTLLKMPAGEAMNEEEG